MSKRMSVDDAKRSGAFIQVSRSSGEIESDWIIAACGYGRAALFNKAQDISKIVRIDELLILNPWLIDPRLS